MPIQAGEVWLADIPFTDKRGTKVRPVLILWVDGADAIVSVITSATPRTRTDVALADWQAAGLRVASTVRLARLDCLEQSLLFRWLGRLSPTDATNLKTIWELHVKPNF